MMREFQNTFVKFYCFFRGEFGDGIWHSCSEPGGAGETACFIPQAGFKKASDNDGSALDKERLYSHLVQVVQHLFNVVLSGAKYYCSCAIEMCLPIAG